MLWLPDVANECCTEAVPFVTVGGPPIGVWPSRNWTLPDALAGVTVAVSVVAVPLTVVAGTVSVVVVGASGTTGVVTVTDCAAAEEFEKPALPAKLP